MVSLSSDETQALAPYVQGLRAWAHSQTAPAVAEPAGVSARFFLAALEAVSGWTERRARQRAAERVLRDLLVCVGGEVPEVAEAVTVYDGVCRPGYEGEEA